MKKYLFASALMLCVQSFLFSKTTVFLSVDGFIQREAYREQSVDWERLSAGGGVNSQIFWSNNFGIFVDIGVKTPLSWTFKASGGNVKLLFDDFTNKIGFYAALGPAYRFDLGGNSSFYIGLGPSYSLQMLGGEFRLLSQNRSFHKFGIVAEPGFVFTFASGLTFEAGLNLGLTFLQYETNIVKVTSAGRAVGGSDSEFKEWAKKYMGFAVTPFVGLGYSFSTGG